MTYTRMQLPVWSPVRGGTLAAAAAGLVAARSAQARLVDRTRAHFNADAVLLTDSGTTALAVALRAASERRGRLPVALPSWACWDLATAAIGADVDVRFYDLDPLTLTPDPASLAAALREGVAAVVIVHAYGIPVPLQAIADEVRAAGALLIEDAAQSFGAAAQGQALGSTGDLTVLSFGRGKGITGGSGGALLARDQARGLVSIRIGRAGARGTRDIAALTALWLMGRPATYSVPASIPGLRLGETIYREPHEPRAMSGAAAAAVDSTWDAALVEASRRRRNAERLVPAAAHRVCARPAADADPGWLRLPVLLPTPAARAVDAQARALGIVSGYPIALSDLPQLRSRVHGESTCLGARELAARLVTLPTHSRLADFDITRLQTWLAGALRSARESVYTGAI